MGKAHKIWERHCPSNFGREHSRFTTPHIIAAMEEYADAVQAEQNWRKNLRTIPIEAIEKFIKSDYGSMIQGEKYISENVLISKINELKGRVIFDDTDQLNPDIKNKMDNFFANVKPAYLVEEFEKMGYTFNEISTVNTLAAALENIKHICTSHNVNDMSDYEVQIYKLCTKALKVCTKALQDFAFKKPIPRNITGPFPTETVLEHLIWATEYLLHRKDYDGPNYEELEICVQNAKVIKATLVVRNDLSLAAEIAAEYVKKKLETEIQQDPEYITKNAQRYKDLFDGYFAAITQ